MDDMSKRVAAYEGLVLATTRYWRRYISMSVSDEDIAQELRIKVWRALCSWDSSRGYPEQNFVYIAVRNRIKSLISRKGLDERDIPHDFSSPSIAESQLSGHVFDQVGARDMLDDLTIDQRMIAALMYQKYTRAQISEITGMTPGAVSSTIKSLREDLSDYRQK